MNLKTRTRILFVGILLAAITYLGIPALADRNPPLCQCYNVTADYYGRWSSPDHEACMYVICRRQ